MVPSELNEKNYRRICLINLLLSVPLLLIFSWPYFLVCKLLTIHRAVAFPGAIIFALPFMLTILHGHVTLALGAVHRHHYYDWLKANPYTYGLLFQPVIISTRFRLILFLMSLMVFIIGWSVS